VLYVTFQILREKSGALLHRAEPRVELRRGETD